jgi:hypothetical protein
MIVRDDSARLARCLESVRSVVDEIIVVDTGSTDDTAAVARAHGAEVIAVPWEDDFSAARNHGLARARGAWIFVLDADEWLPLESVEPLRALVAREPKEAFHLLQTSRTPDGETVRAPTVRLFPNRPDVRFRFPLHEEVNFDLRCAGIPMRATPIEFGHAGYADHAEIDRKRERNLRIVTAALARHPRPDEAVHLRFFRACFHRDRQEWAAAAEDFAWCAEHAKTWRPGVTDAARLRLAECLLALGEIERARAALAPAPGLARHPLALCLQARIALVRGEKVAARGHYEIVRTLPEGPYSPSVALGPLKAEAAQFLAQAASA